MQMNWSIILNVVLLIGVLFAIVSVLRSRKKLNDSEARSSSLGAQRPSVEPIQHDDIIAVRKLNVESPRLYSDEQVVDEALIDTSDEKAVELESDMYVAPHRDVIEEKNASSIRPDSSLPIMMFLLAKGNRQLAGYELLQAVLSAGLRFGEGHLFHRHQHANGQGPILCSLAAATDQGTFDLQNIGAFMVRGLCLYMHPSGNPGIDAERFDIMLDTAKTLSEDLDTHLLDDRRKPLSDSSIQRYHQRLNLIEEAV